LRLIDDIAFGEGHDVREIFDAPFTYVNGELARLYGLPLPPAARPEAFTRVALPAGGPRRGGVGQARFLGTHRPPPGPPPTTRGRFIAEALLCQPVPPPLPNVSTKLPHDSEGSAPRTTRQRLLAHRTSPKCAGCHKAMDPLGLAFETFDG